MILLNRPFFQPPPAEPDVLPTKRKRKHYPDYSPGSSCYIIQFYWKEKHAQYFSPAVLQEIYLYCKRRKMKPRLYPASVYAPEDAPAVQIYAETNRQGWTNARRYLSKYHRGAHVTCSSRPADPFEQMRKSMRKEQSTSYAHT